MMHTPKTSPMPRTHALLVLALLTAAVSTGCTRGKYYLQADREVSTLLAEKSCDPRWAVPVSYNVRQDERSRFYDAYNQVFPPMPPDDPTSHRYMHCIDGKWGFPRWHINGDRTTLDNPAWRARVHEVANITESGAVVLDEQTAMRLAYLNSIDWQDQLETLYLSALDTTTERFKFDVQFFGGNDTTYRNRGSLNPLGTATSWTTATGLEARRYFATAGEAVVGLLNSVVWQFAGPDQYTNVSILNFNLVQPLLRNAGRSIALETLTIAERTLLANLRNLQFYRQGFYLQVVFGGNSPPGLQRRGGFAGGTGFAGFSGTGIGGFGNIGGVFFGGNGVGLNTAGGGTGGAGFAGGGAGNVGGFYGLLQSRQQIRNAEQNLASQERALALLDANLEAGLVGIDQVDQLRQSVETSRAGLLQAKTSLVNQFESFKVRTLNMPSDTAMVLDESFIKRFQFISPEMQLLQNDIGDFLGVYSFGAAQPLKETEDPRQDPLRDDPEALELVPPALEGQPAPLPPPLDADSDATEAEQSVAPQTEKIRDELSRTLIAAAIENLDALRDRVEEQANAVRTDLAEVPDEAAIRLTGMRPTERETFDREMRLLSDDLVRLLGQINEAEDEIEVLAGGLTEESLRPTADAIVELVSDVSAAVDEMSLIQARARVEAINIVPERINPDTAFEIARANRLDWMNARARLVDQWRLIQYNAMALLAGLDVEIDGNVRTTGNNPARLRGPTGGMSASLAFDAPLTRLRERNNFRQAIIQYQQVRRQQITYEDSIKLSIRQSLRQLELSERNLETQRRAVIIAIRRVDQTRLTLMQPSDPPPPPSLDGSAPIADTSAGQLSPTATLNLIYAFNDLRSSQDALTSIWINYLATRASLALQLGVMELTDDGMWVDKPLSTADRASADELPLPPAVPQEWLDHLEEVAPPPPLPQGADVQILDGEPARLPDVAARSLPPVESDEKAEEPGRMPAPEAASGILPASAAEEQEKPWASLIPSFLSSP
jgi:hypothetical protein